MNPDIDQALKNEPGPQVEVSRRIAGEIYDRLPQLEEWAAQAGMVQQDEWAERYEWCRCVGIIIEAVLSDL